MKNQSRTFLAEWCESAVLMGISSIVGLSMGTFIERDLKQSSADAMTEELVVFTLVCILFPIMTSFISTHNRRHGEGLESLPTTFPPRF